MAERTKDEYLWEFQFAVANYQQSKEGLERAEATMRECWHACPLENHPEAPRMDGGVGYDYSLCPIHGPILREIDEVFFPGRLLDG